MSSTETNSVCEPIIFSSDGFCLSGTLHLPPGVCKPPVVVGSHGLLSTGDSPKQVALAQKCNQCGMAFFRFDHRGCGQSEGIFNEVTSLENRCNDLINAIRMLRSRKDIGAQVGLFGSSMGGATCLTAATMIDVGPLVTVAAPVRISLTGRETELTALPGSEAIPMNLEFDISDKLSQVRHILMFHGDADEVVPVSDVIEIYEKAGRPKRRIVQKHGDHLMSNIRHQESFVRESVLWFKTGFGRRNMQGGHFMPTLQSMGDMTCNWKIYGKTETW